MPRRLLVAGGRVAGARVGSRAAEGLAVVAPAEDAGYVSPDFDLPSGDEDEDEVAPPPPAKRRRAVAERDELEDDEALALQLLRSRR